MRRLAWVLVIVALVVAVPAVIRHAQGDTWRWCYTSTEHASWDCYASKDDRRPEVNTRLVYSGPESGIREASSR